MSSYKHEDYLREFLYLVRSVGAHDEPRLPVMGEVSADLLAFDLEERSRLAESRAWVWSEAGKQVIDGLLSPPEDDEAPLAERESAATKTREVLAAKLKRLRGPR